MGPPFIYFFFSFLTHKKVFHLEIMASFSSHGFSFTKDSYISSSLSDDEIIQEMFANMFLWLQLLLLTHLIFLMSMNCRRMRVNPWIQVWGLRICSLLCEQHQDCSKLWLTSFLPSLTSWLQQYLPLPPCMTYRWTPYSSF